MTITRSFPSKGGDYLGRQRNENPQGTDEAEAAEEAEVLASLGDNSQNAFGGLSPK